MMMGTTDKMMVWHSPDAQSGQSEDTSLLVQGSVEEYAGEPLSQQSIEWVPQIYFVPVVVEESAPVVQGQSIIPRVSG
jgi:hypothetical protein